MRQVLPDLISTDTGTAVNAVLIQKKTAAFFHVKLPIWLALNGSKTLPWHDKSPCFYAAIDNHEFAEIGAQFDNRNHTTVLHACRKIEEKMRIDGNMRENIRILEMLIKS